MKIGPPFLEPEHIWDKGVIATDGGSIISVEISGLPFGSIIISKIVEQ